MSQPITQAFADELTRVAVTQLRASRQHKQPRMEKIKKFEDLYNGITEKSINNPFNDDFGFLSGLVDFLISDIDDPPAVKYKHNDLADYKHAMKVSAAFDTEAQSAMPNAKWPLKDRWAKRLAAFSGRGIYALSMDSEPEFKTTFRAVDHYSFHCEPNGGGLLENHLFCGEDDIFKTKEELLMGAQSGYYDPFQVAELADNTGANDYKENEDAYQNQQNRSRALGLDPATNNYTGQQMHRLVQWCMTYQGSRWYLLFEERSGRWVRVKPLEEVFPRGIYPYVSFATHEDLRVFWSKGPCDSAYSIATNINRFMNQELYNREKRNLGREFYDVDMITDLEQLINPGPDRKIPVDTKQGTRKVSEAVFRSADGEINGTIDLVAFLDAFGGRKNASTPGSQGQAGKDKAVGIYFGELQQIKNRLSTYNKSYRESWEELGMRYLYGLDEFLTKPLAVKVMGTDGSVGWEELTREDLNRRREFSTSCVGGQEQDQLDELQNQKKSAALQVVASVNPRWKDRQILKTAGYTEDQIKEAFEGEGASMELLSEAAMAVNDIISGKQPKLNRGATTAFMQYIIDQAGDLEALPAETFDKLLAYAEAHTEIAIRNAKTAMMKIAQATAALPAGGAPIAPAPRPAAAPSPVPAVPPMPGQ